MEPPRPPNNFLVYNSWENCWIEWNPCWLECRQSSHRKVTSHFKNKLMWTAAVLLLYFILTNIPVFGLSATSIDVFQYYRALLAGAQGTILHLGIGPIVTASIVLQLLLRGADLIKINTSDQRGQVLYMGLQKVLIFVMIILEALPNVLGGWMSADPAVSAFFGGNAGFVMLLIFLQICIGGKTKHRNVR